MPPLNAIKIGRHEISQNTPTWVIAEAGVNHNGDPDLAVKLVKAAKEAQADCIKFQTFKADRLAAPTAPKAAYQKKSTNPKQSQLEMLRSLELSRDEYRRIIDACHEHQIVFLSTPYSREDADFLESLEVPAYKIASGQAVEPHLLEHIARKNKPVILSTGMCTLAETQRAIETIRNAGNQQIITLHCTTNYPSPVTDANLRAMTTIRDRLDVLVGYSDHTESLTSAAVAVALGACVIERHLTLDKTLPGPDQSCSSDPEQFNQLVQIIREAEQSLGSPEKKPTASEQAALGDIRRGIVAAQTIPTDTPLTMQNITLKRPLEYLGGEDLPTILGRKTKTAINTNTPITREMIQ